MSTTLGLELAVLLANLLRPVVLQQLLLLASSVGMWLLLRWIWRRQQPARPLVEGWVLLVLLALICLLANQLQAVQGLLVNTTLGVTLWMASRTLVAVAQQRLPTLPVERLDLRLVRPLMLVLLLGLLLKPLINLDALADAPLVRWGEWSLSYGDTILLVLGTYFLAVGSLLPAILLAWICRQLFQLDNSGYRTTQLLFRYGLVSAGLVILLMAVGVNPALVAAVGGGLSVGLGFGLKEVVSNFVSGLWLLLEGAVRPGDVLLMDHQRGEDPCEVIALGLRATTLWRDRDNVELVVPNTTFFTQQMATFTGVLDKHRRTELKIGAAYRHPPQQVITLLEHTTAAVSGVMDAPAPRGFLLEYDDSAITYSVRFWIANPMQGTAVRSAVGVALWEAFHAAGIEIPFPQRVVHQLPAGGTTGSGRGAEGTAN